MQFIYVDPKGIGLYEVAGWQGARAYFTTRRGGVSTGPYCCMNLGSGGGDSPEKVERNLDKLCSALDITRESLVLMEQAHSNTVRAVEEPDNPLSGFGHDATITNLPGLALGVLVADCVPILLYDPAKRAVGAVHSGWKGTVSDVPGEAVEAMRQKYGSSPSDIMAAIGPAIGPCCYEVDGHVVDPLRTSMGEPDGLLTDRGGGKWLLDLWKANTELLVRAGVERENIDVMGLCTSCNHERFYSYRKDGAKTGRMMGLVMLEG